MSSYCLELEELVSEKEKCTMEQWRIQKIVLGGGVWELCPSGSAVGRAPLDRSGGKARPQKQCILCNGKSVFVNTKM